MARPRRNRTAVNYSLAGATDDYSSDEFDPTNHDDDDDDEMDDEIPDELEPDDEQDEEEEEIRPRIKQRARPKPIGKVSLVSYIAPDTTALAARKVTKTVAAKPRAKTQETIRNRMLVSFGSNREKLAHVTELRVDWERIMFGVDDSLCAAPAPWGAAEFQDATLEPITAEEVRARISLKGEIQVGVNLGAPVGITTEAAVPFPQEVADQEREGVFVYAGGMVTELSWRETISDTHANSVNGVSSTSPAYLAVAVTDITSPVDPRLASNHAHSYTSALRIYRHDSTGIVLHLSYLLEYGAVWNLRWVRTVRAGLGVLAFACKDGCVRFLKLPDTPGHFHVRSPSLEISLPDQLLTSFDLFTDKLIAGTNRGYLCEFPFTGTASSFAYPLHTELVHSVTCATNAYANELVLSLAMDLNTSLVDLRDIRASNVVMRMKLLQASAAYVPQLHAFVITEGAYPVRVFSERISVPGSVLMKHDSSASCVAASARHPMTLSGGADGCVKITNVLRKLMNKKKSPADLYQVLNLWRVEYAAARDVFRVDLAFTTETVKNGEVATSAPVYPHAVNVSSISWNQSPGAAAWYAVAFSSGLIIVERLTRK
ncbi:hypothetical protein BABINDRAFT_159853 [Babjeviella inositovora NRRL Y-12698]|uniref:Uncharacterized protein n=1 Tax=Babjeviella inositovora NRRL Y-12698 TaxID=984486 RepID=A0A1E3QV94_9ASCO|nr:uncharacterized protein BABINDRAFT_159853 [Babjeviella inositovora NRRL Y-12698]ODQ81581.1 hypothetical protein BABINDRAFT_159853 [Babjeviella inositovora NRRL Y-12698]